MQICRPEDTWKVESFRSYAKNVTTFVLFGASATHDCSVGEKKQRISKTKKMCHEPHLCHVSFYLGGKYFLLPIMMSLSFHILVVRKDVVGARQHVCSNLEKTLY